MPELHPAGPVRRLSAPVGASSLAGSKYPMIRYLGLVVVVIMIQVLGKYMIIRYLDP